MSFIKYGFMALIGKGGQLIFVFGILATIMTISSGASTDKVVSAIGILLFGIILIWYARFRRKTIVVERGVKDAQKED